MLSLSCVWIVVTPWTAARQAPLSKGILPAGIPEWVAISFSRGSSQPRDPTQVSCTAGRFFTTEPPGKPKHSYLMVEIIIWDAIFTLFNFYQYSLARSVFIPIPKKGNTKECSNYCTIALISHTSKIMLKILQARLQQYMNHELPDVQARFSKGRGTRDQIASIHWIIEKVREFQKNIYCFIDYAKAFDCVDHNKLWKILKEMGVPDHLTCLL